MISIKTADNGRIVNLYDGTVPGSWVTVNESDFPGESDPLWRVTPPKDNLTPHMYYLPHRDSTDPPTDKNDYPGDSWSDQSTTVIGLIFEEQPEDDTSIE